MTAVAPSEVRLTKKRRLPIVESAEAADCALACLTMIARYHGLDVDLNSMRQRFSSSLTGTTLRSLMHMADQLGFSTRPLKVELTALSRLVLPAVLHWDLNHFVVLSRISGKCFRIHDPARGVLTISIGELSDHFTGVALELRPSREFAPISMRTPLKMSQLWSASEGIVPAVLQVLVLSALLQVATFTLPLQLQVTVDDVIGNGDTGLLTAIVVGFSCLVLLQVSIEYLRNKAVLLASSMFGYQILGNLVRRLLRLETAYFEKRHTGDILSRIRSTEPIRDAVSQGIISVMIDGVMAVTAIILLFAYSTLLASIVSASVVLYIGFMAATYPIMRDRLKIQLVACASEQTNLMENVRAAQTIKLMGREAERESIWRNRYADVVNAQLATSMLHITTNSIRTLIMGLQTVFVVYFGALMVLRESGFSIGMLFAFFSFSQTFSDRISSMASQAFQFALVGVHLDRMSDIVHAQIDGASAPPFPLPLRGEISLGGVCFRYGKNDRPILQNVTFKIDAGEFVAIVGPSGGGKTTLVKLLAGLYSPDSGEIYIDGLAVSGSIWSTLRQSISIVAQDDSLLSGSIADNISFFDPGIDMERVHRAAAAAQIYDDIMKMPMRFLSLVGDMGSTLSGGQKQRVLLARALYREPKILILDEGTANLDAGTEGRVAELISGLRMTRIVVAHRPSLVGRADRVFLMNDGQLDELADGGMHSVGA